MSSDVALSAVNRLPSFGAEIAFPLLGCKVAPPLLRFSIILLSHLTCLVCLTR